MDTGTCEETELIKGFERLLKDLWVLEYGIINMKEFVAYAFF